MIKNNLWPKEQRTKATPEDLGAKQRTLGELWNASWTEHNFFEHLWKSFKRDADFKIGVLAGITPKTGMLLMILQGDKYVFVKPEDFWGQWRELPYVEIEFQESK